MQGPAFIMGMRGQSYAGQPCICPLKPHLWKYGDVQGHGLAVSHDSWEKPNYCWFDHFFKKNMLDKTPDW